MLTSCQTVTTYRFDHKIITSMELLKGSILSSLDSKNITREIIKGRYLNMKLAVDLPNISS